MKKLIEGAMQKDADAFTKLMESYSLQMYKIAISILNNNEDAADAIQSTILTCYEKMDTLRNPEYFKTWMIRILINECNQIIRCNRHECLLEEFPEVTKADASMEYVEFRELINTLDEKYRLVMLLYYGEDLKVSQIAELLDMKEATVKTRLKRARGVLQKEYSKIIPIKGGAVL